MKRFRKFFVEITNECGRSCPFCPKTRRPPQTMDVALFQRILLEASPYTEELYFHVMGEPLRHPELGRFLDLSRERGFRVKIVTSGDRIAELGGMLASKPALRQVSFSLHGIEGEGALAPILRFARQASGGGIGIYLRFWSLDENGALPERDRRLLEAVLREFGRGALPPLGGKAVELAPRVHLSSMARFEWPSLDPSLRPEDGTCPGMTRQAAVLAGGEVVPCCLDKDGVMSLGNIRERPLKELLESERARAIVQGFRSRKPAEELCRRCTYKRRFKRPPP
ncbi:MAG TPA: radical SAM protein [Elusimicrobia bacterium]|nr:radical SAM protein [Elusimicrobiota bacterium]